MSPPFDCCVAAVAAADGFATAAAAAIVVVVDLIVVSLLLLLLGFKLLKMENLLLRLGLLPSALRLDLLLECFVLGLSRRRISLLKLATMKTIASQPRETFQPPRQRKGRRRPNPPPLSESLCLRWVMLSPQRQLLRSGQVRRNQPKFRKSRMGIMGGPEVRFFRQSHTLRQP
jgi:hypothetical protein